MAKKDSSEETTKGLVADKLKEIDGYPMAQNTTVDGITWFKEDSYKGTSYQRSRLCVQRERQIML